MNVKRYVVRLANNFCVEKDFWLLVEIRLEYFWMHARAKQSTFISLWSGLGPGGKVWIRFAYDHGINPGPPQTNLPSVPLSWAFGTLDQGSIWTHTHTDIETQRHRDTKTETHRHTKTETHTHTGIHTHTHKHTDTQTHTHTHTHTHAPTRTQ